MLVSPVVLPHIFRAYANMASSLVLSSSLLSADSKRPFAQEWPWYQSKAREKGKRGSVVEGLPASRIRVLIQSLLLPVVSQLGSR